MNRFQYCIYTILILTLVLGCKNQEAEAKDLEKSKLQITVSHEQFESGELMLGEVEERNFPVTVQATGIIEVPPQNKAVVSAFIGGYVKDTVIAYHRKSGVCNPSAKLS